MARVLRLDDVEREHLRRLFLAATEGSTPAPIVTSVRPEIRRLLDALGVAPALAMNKRLGVVAANLLGRALYAPMYDGARDSMNLGWFHFGMQDAARAFWLDWAALADDGVAILRTELGVHPMDHELADLIEDLLGNEEFATRWASHDVHRHTTGVKRIHHPVVGRIDLPYEHFSSAADPDLTIQIFNPEPATPAYDSLNSRACGHATTPTTRTRTGERPATPDSYATGPFGFGGH